MWDSVFSGGLFNLSIGIIPFFILMYQHKKLKIKNKKLLISLIVTFMFSVLLLLRERYLGWYWYPFITLLPLITFCFDINKDAIKLFLFLILINGITNYPLIKERVTLRLDHEKILQNKEKIIRCFNEKIHSYENVRIYNFSEFALLQSKIAYKNLAYGDIMPSSIIILGDRLTKHRKELHLNNLFSKIQKNNNCPVYIGKCSGMNIIEVKQCK